MDVTQAHSTRVKVDLGLRLAAPAWDGFRQRTGVPGTSPTVVIKLKSQRPSSKSGVYLLVGAAEDGSNVVAKRCRRSTAWVERAVYEYVLPHVSVTKLHYHGYADDGVDDFCWLFLEDAGDTKLLELQRSLAAEWLARLHTEAARFVGQAALPERGPAHYRQHLRTARELIGELQKEPSTADVAVRAETLRRLSDLLDRLDAEWDATSGACAAAPTTLVHGDFGKKNLRTRLRDERTELAALDWETAGWGPIAADLPQMQCRDKRIPRPGKPLTWRGTVPVDAYFTCARGRWGTSGEPTLSDLTRIAAVGTLFRYVSSIRWAAEQVIAGGAEKAIARLELYAAELPQAMAAVDC